MFVSGKEKVILCELICITKEWVELKRISGHHPEWSNPSVSAGSPAASCSRPCPDGFHVSLRMETPSTTLLGKLCQFSVTLRVKTFFLVFIRNVLFQIVPISSCLSLGIMEKSLAPSWYKYLPFRYLYIFMRCPLNLLFAMLNRSISHNFPLCKWYSNPLVTVMGLHWSLLCGSIISFVQFLKLQLNLTAVFIFCL